MMALDAEGGIADDSDEEGDSFVGMSTPTRPGHRSAHSASSIMTTTELGSKRPIPLGRLRFSVLLQTILQDTQTRLVFRAQAVIQAEVLRYVPTPDELAYPAILQAQTGAEGDRMLWEDDDLLASDRDGGFRAPREEVQVTWFATLRRTVWVLSRLHTYVNVSLFVSRYLLTVTECHLPGLCRGSRHALSTVARGGVVADRAAGGQCQDRRPALPHSPSPHLEGDDPKRGPGSCRAGCRLQLGHRFVLSSCMAVLIS